jgi:hypothetical protein
MFFCAGRAIGANLVDADDSDSEWDSDSFYHHHQHNPFSPMHHHHHGDADSKISKMGSLMFVVRSPRSVLRIELISQSKVQRECESYRFVRRKELEVREKERNAVDCFKAERQKWPKN